MSYSVDAYDNGGKKPRGCRYIFGDVPSPDWRYCAKPPRQGSPYCPKHHDACYAGMPKRKALKHRLKDAE